MANSQTEMLSRREAGAVFLPLKRAGLALFAASAFLNLLALNGPLFMLQVYDRVLASRSVPTLVALCVLAGMLYGFQALLDGLRARLLLRLGEGLDTRFSRTVLSAIARLPLAARVSGDGQQPMRDLDTVRAFLSGPGPGAFLDLPWVPLYLGICFLLHVWLGVTALAGAVLLFSLTLAADFAVRRPSRVAVDKGMERAAVSEAARRNAESIRAMGMEEAVYDRWQGHNRSYLAASRKSGDTGASMNALARALRQALQSAILAVGAWLVIEQQASAGVMIAASVMMGRAMAPVDTAIAQWKHFVGARQGWQRLRGILRDFAPKEEVLKLPAPCRTVQVADLVVVPPGGGAPCLANVSFRLEAGAALGVIGPSGCGKTSLARVLTGVWAPPRGDVRIDGASLDQWNPVDLGCHIGYLPQSAELFEGTIAENIARFRPGARDEDIVEAAQAARAHDFIISLPKGYQTGIGLDGAGLSGGQKQRIGLARALFGNPFLLVLDEPNANLDATGEEALLKAIQHQKERNGIAVVIAHRPSAMAAVDQVLILENGRVKALGPKEEVLAQVMKKPGAVPVPVKTPSSHGAQMLNPLRVVASSPLTPEIPKAAEPGKETSE